jgi:DNA integrity scanning protein DisA with diadenylate cyclase activity
MYNLEDKICSFNVNEYHLVTILMPYIYEAINKEKKIITFFEKNLKPIYEKVLNTSSMFWKNKENLDTVDWNKLELDKISEKFKYAEDKSIVIIAGTKDFVERINKLVLNFHTNFTLVNCFEINEFSKNTEIKINDYSKMLNTKGIQEIKEKNLV